ALAGSGTLPYVCSSYVGGTMTRSLYAPFPAAYDASHTERHGQIIHGIWCRRSRVCVSCAPVRYYSGRVSQMPLPCLCETIATSYATHWARRRWGTGTLVGSLYLSSRMLHHFHGELTTSCSWKAVCDKFRRCTASISSARQATALIDAVGALEQGGDMAAV